MNDSDLLRPAQFDSLVLSCCHNASAAYAPFMAEEESFGRRLAAARARAKLTQAQLGEGLGTKGEPTTKQTVYGWEKDQHYPRVDQLMLICEKLGISADFLLFGDEAAASNVRVAAAAAALQQLDADERLRLVEKVRDAEAGADQMVKQTRRSGKDLQAPVQNNSAGPETSYSQPINKGKEPPAQRAYRGARHLMDLDDAAKQSSTNRNSPRPKTR